VIPLLKIAQTILSAHLRRPSVLNRAGIDQHLITLAAPQPVERHTHGLAHNVPEGDGDEEEPTAITDTVQKRRVGLHIHHRFAYEVGRHQVIDIFRTSG